MAEMARAPKRTWPAHEAWVREQRCIVPGCRQAPSQFCHVRSAANSGTGLKPFASFGVAMCALRHAEQHRLGQPGFERRYGISLFGTAAEFYRRSPDLATKAALQDVATQYLDSAWNAGDPTHPG